MAKFRINSRVAVEELFLDSTSKPDGGQRRITLQLAGWDGGTQPDITAGAGGYAKLVDVTHDAKSKVSTFTVEAVKGAKGVAYIYDRNSPQKSGAMLRLNLGEVTNHKDCTIDLVAELLGRSEDPVHLWVYQRILAAKNNQVPMDRDDYDRLLADQPLKQSIAKMNCGAALNQFDWTYFGKNHMATARIQYYKPFKSAPNPKDNKKADIQFFDDRVSRGAASIKQLLSQQKAVIVFVVHHDSFEVNNGRIKQTGKTHFLNIVGCNADATKFLYTDPWPGGAYIDYESGIFGKVRTAFMGTMELTHRGGEILSTSASNYGALNCTLLEGPS